MKNLTEADFDAETAAADLALVDFHASWCGPCKSMEPSLAAVDGKPAQVFKVDIDAAPEIAMRYGIRGVPTLLVMKKGEVVDIKSGAQSQSQLSSWIAQHA